MIGIQKGRTSNRAIIPRILPLLTLLFTICTAQYVSAASVTLTWNRNQEPDIAGYIVYWGTSSRDYSNSVEIHDTANAPAQRIYTIDGLEQGKTYYFALKAVDLAGQKSDYSEEVVKYLTDGDLTLTSKLLDVTPTDESSSQSYEAITPGDLNGDGKTDLVLFAQDGVYISLSDGSDFGQPSLWYSYADNLGYSYSLSAGALENGWNVTGTGDINGDGYDDILLNNPETGTVSIWFMGSDGFNHERTISDPAICQMTAYGPADFDGNGRADILFHDPNSGKMYVWFMQDDSTYHSKFVGLFPTGSFKIMDLADYDGNGTADILWHEPTEDFYSVCYTTDDHVLMRQCQYIGTPEDYTSTVAGSGDFNGDGTQDILWYDKDSEDVYTWFMSGQGVEGTMSMAPSPLQDGTIIGVGDINSDKLADIIWGSSDNSKITQQLTQ